MQVIAAIIGILIPVVGANEPPPQFYDVKSADPRELVQEYITEASPEYLRYAAMTVAYCESRFDPYAKNPDSTAKGVYQFIDRTWENYCTGDVLDYKDNIDCFLEQFPRNPHWWDASGACWK